MLKVVVVAAVAGARKHPKQMSFTRMHREQTASRFQLKSHAATQEKKTTSVAVTIKRI